MQQKISTSSISGAALLSFALLSCGLYFYNLKLATELMWFFVPVGAFGVAIGLVFILFKRLRPNTKLRKPKQLFPLLLLLASLAALVSGFIWIVMPTLLTLGVPVLVLFAHAASCEFLIRARVSKTCTLLLIASVILEIATWWAADRIGSDRGADSVRLLTDPLIVCWLICVIAATFSIGEMRSSGTAEPEETVDEPRNFVTYLWAASSMIWMISLVLIRGTAEMSVP